MKFLVPLTIIVCLTAGSASASDGDPYACGAMTRDAGNVAAVLDAAEVACPCDGFTSHGRYVRCFRGVVKTAVEAGSLRRNCKGKAMLAGSRSTCGRDAAAVTCCRENALGSATCTIASSEDRCTPVPGGTASVGDTESCFDACPQPSPIATPTPTIAPTPTPAPTAAPITGSVCKRWKDDRARFSSVNWSGSVSGCNAGDISAGDRQDVVAAVNLYRYLAGLPGVTNSAALDSKAQQCALMMHANNQTTHSPPSSWKCYTSAGADAAAHSVVAHAGGVGAIDLWMDDPGNPTTLGHRRWLLSNYISPIGIGSTDLFSCLWVYGGSSGNRQWTAWPPAGQVPIQALGTWVSQDSTGWSLQSNSIDFSTAKVTITDGGHSRPVKVTKLLQGFGSMFAISMIPQGWTTQAGHTYTVNVTNISKPFSYTVEVVNCG